MKYCTNCGQRLSNSPNFCGECGERLVENVKDSYAHPELTEESSLEEKVEIFNPQNYIIEFLKVNIPDEKGVLTCPRCLGDGYVNEQDIERLHTSLFWAPGDCLYCSSIGKVNIKNIIIDTFPYTKEEFQWVSEFRDAMADEIFGEDEWEENNFNPDIYFSTYIDDETTFLGHDSIVNRINSEVKTKNKRFQINLLEFLEEYDLANDEMIFHFLYSFDEMILLVFSINNEIGTFFIADHDKIFEGNQTGIFFWNLLDINAFCFKVVKETKDYAIIKFNYDNQTVNLRFWKPGSGFFSVPWIKWRFDFSDIINAMNDGFKEYKSLIE